MLPPDRAPSSQLQREHHQPTSLQSSCKCFKAKPGLPRNGPAPFFIYTSSSPETECMEDALCILRVGWKGGHLMPMPNWSCTSLIYAGELGQHHPSALPWVLPQALPVLSDCNVIKLHLTITSLNYYQLQCHHNYDFHHVLPPEGDGPQVTIGQPQQPNCTG